MNIKCINNNNDYCFYNLALNTINVTFNINNNNDNNDKYKKIRNYT